MKFLQQVVATAGEALANTTLQLRQPGDATSALGYSPATAIDGPRLTGAAQGELGTLNGAGTYSQSLWWSATGVSIPGTLAVTGALSSSARITGSELRATTGKVVFGSETANWDGIVYDETTNSYTFLADSPSNDIANPGTGNLDFLAMTARGDAEIYGGLYVGTEVSADTGSYTGTVMVGTAGSDVDATANNRPPLMVGDISTVHLRMDGNECFAMATPTTRNSYSFNGMTVLGNGRFYGPNVGGSGFAVERGSVSGLVAPSAGGVISGSGSFTAGRFTVAPTVTITVNSSVPQNCAVGINNVTTTGFTFYFYRTNNTSTSVSWIAVGD